MITTSDAKIIPFPSATHDDIILIQFDNIIDELTDQFHKADAKLLAITYNYYRCQSHKHIFLAENNKNDKELYNKHKKISDMALRNCRLIRQNKLTFGLIATNTVKDFSDTLETI